MIPRLKLENNRLLFLSIQIPLLGQKPAQHPSLAATYGQVDAINALISANASVKARDDERRTAIFRAAAKGRVNAIERLHELGADLSSRDNYGSTPIFVAVALRSKNSSNLTLIPGVRTIKARVRGRMLNSNTRIRYPS